MTFAVPANALTTFEPVKINPGESKTKPDSPETTNSMFSALVVPPNSTVTFTEVVPVFTA